MFCSSKTSSRTITLKEKHTPHICFPYVCLFLKNYSNKKDTQHLNSLTETLIEKCLNIMKKYMSFKQIVLSALFSFR